MIGKPSVGLIAALCLLFPALAAAQGTKPAQLAALDLPAGSPLPLRIKSTPRCMFGDFDLIAADMGGGKQGSLILTVERLDEPAAPPLAMASLYGPGLGAAILSRDGYGLELPPAAASAPQLLGIYICRDAARTGRCGDKPLVPFGQALDAHSSKNPAAQVKVADKVYFFSFIIASGGKIHFSNQLFDDDVLARLPAQVRALLKSAPDPAAFTRLTKAIRTIGSEPLALDGGKLVIDLPRVDIRRCGQVREPPPARADPPREERPPAE